MPNDMARGGSSLGRDCRRRVERARRLLAANATGSARVPKRWVHELNVRRTRVRFVDTALDHAVREAQASGASPE